MELIAKAGKEDIELFLVLVREDGEGSGEPVLGGVPRGGGCANAAQRLRPNSNA
jgi:hypothetical protein